MFRINKYQKPEEWAFDRGLVEGGDGEWGWFHNDVLSFIPFWENAGVPRAYGRLNEQLQQQGTALWGDTPYGAGTSHTATDFFEFQNATYSSDYLGSAFTIFFTVFYDGSSTGFMYDDRDIGQGITVGFFGESADLTGVIEVNGGANVVPQYTPAIPAGLRTVCFRWDGTDCSISVDSDPGNPGTGSLSGTITLTDKRPRIGRGDVGQNIPVQAPNRILSASFFDTYRSDQEVLQVFEDPFGMFRMRSSLFAPFVSVPAAPVVSAELTQSLIQINRSLILH